MNTSPERRPARTWFADDDLHITAEPGEECHEALGREASQPAAHEFGDLRLVDAENLPRSGLRDSTSAQRAGDERRELGFSQSLARLRDLEILEDIAAASRKRWSGGVGHLVHLRVLVRIS